MAVVVKRAIYAVLLGLFLNINNLFAIDLSGWEAVTEIKDGPLVALVNTGALAGSQFNGQNNPDITEEQAKIKAIQTAGQFLTEKGNLFGISNPTTDLSLKLFKIDNIGLRLLTFEQKYAGVPVYGAELLIQVSPRNEIISTYARILKNAAIDTNINFGAESAVLVARKDMEKRYGWDKILTAETKKAKKTCTKLSKKSGKNVKRCINKEIKKFTKINSFYLNANPDLVDYNDGFANLGAETKNYLAWRLIINDRQGQSEEFLVDAHLGSILKNTQVISENISGNIYDCSNLNRTVANQASALAKDGGIFNGCTVSKLGTAKVDQIWSRAVSTYFLSANSFKQAYTALNQACQDLKLHPDVLASLVISDADCTAFKKALQSVKMDQGGTCSATPATIPECALIPGDFNKDSVVDIIDYNLWRSQFGNTGTSLAADGNGDGTVDSSDYLIWRKNLGRTA
jgi:Zn-dependent metalloprotease